MIGARRKSRSADFPLTEEDVGGTVTLGTWRADLTEDVAPVLRKRELAADLATSRKSESW